MHFKLNIFTFFKTLVADLDDSDRNLDHTEWIKTKNELLMKISISCNLSCLFALMEFICDMGLTVLNNHVMNS